MSLQDIRLSFLPLVVGTGMLCISLPNFTAYTELVRGRLPFIPPHNRPLAAMFCFSPAIGCLFAMYITEEKGQWPSVFNASMVTFAVALVIFGVSLRWSDHIRDVAVWAEGVMTEEEEEEAADKRKRASPMSVGGRSSCLSPVLDEPEEKEFDLEKAAAKLGSEQELEKAREVDEEPASGGSGRQ